MHTPVTPQFQYRLRHLLGAVVLICMVVAVGAQSGWPLAMLLALIAWLVIRLILKPSRARFLVSAAVVIVSSLLYSSMNEVRTPTLRNVCQSNLAILGMALKSYHEDWNSFPPAYVPDENGMPRHSWRVHLLPYLDGLALYEKYDWSEAWNGPNNRSIAEHRFNFFSCPAEPNPDWRGTSYLAVVGPGTAWPGTSCAKLSDFKDGPQDTILLVEVVDSGVRWAEPRDLHVVQMPWIINPPSGQGLSSRHPDGLHVLFASGHTEFLPASTAPKVLRAMFTTNGGEQLPSR